MALLGYDINEKGLFDISLNKVDLNEILNDSYLKDINEEKFLLNKEIERIKQSIPIEKEEIILDEKKKVYNIICKNLEYDYKYKEEVNTASRVSVSKLKRDYLTSLKDDREENNIIFDDNIEKEFNMPSFLNNDKKYTPVRKGILVHFLLENLDFKKELSKDELRKYIKDLVSNNVLNVEDEKQINLTRIYNFLNSKIGQSLKEATVIYKEQEFVLKNSKISKSIIQGVIDLYYINKNNNVILVDFKTDRIKDEKEYIKKYKIQLDIYKEAIEKITNLKVEKVYIYSFELNKEIEVK